MRALTLGSLSPAAAASAGARRHYNAALKLHMGGCAEQAVDRYLQAIALAPKLAPVHANLGAVLLELDRLREGVDALREAIGSDPYCGEAHSNLGAALKALGDPIAAIRHHQAALRIAPRDARFRRMFLETVADVRFARVSPDLRGDLLEILAHEDVDHQLMAFPVATIVAGAPYFDTLVEIARRGGPAASLEDWRAAGLGALATDPLFVGCLARTIFRDATLESILTGARRAVAADVAEHRAADRLSDLLPFICSLACQCSLNEFIYPVSADEAQAIRFLRKEIVEKLRRPNPSDAALVATLACYEPLAELEMDEALSALAQEPATRISQLVALQVRDVRADGAARATIPSLGKIAGELSKRVRGQYEEDPYPRWLGTGRSPEPETIPRVLRRLFPTLAFDPLPATESPEILVAGCGTGQQVVDRATGVADSSVVGLDLSLSSLAYGKRRADELGLGNAMFVHGDLLDAGRLGRRFDLIECIGVLHHLENPEAGLAALARTLKPGGVMRIGLYSRLARRDVEATQALVRKLGYCGSHESIRECRQHLLALRHTSAGSVTRIVDFYSRSEVRDLLFHVHERSFALPEIGEMIARLGLSFVGLEAGRAARDTVPLTTEQAEPISLSRWHDFEQENPDTFVGMYLLWLKAPTGRVS